MHTDQYIPLILSVRHWQKTTHEAQPVGSCTDRGLSVRFMLPVDVSHPPQALLGLLVRMYLCSFAFRLGHARTLKACTCVLLPSVWVMQGH